MMCAEDTKAMIRVKRIYEPPEVVDGYRILVDRIWPRGVSKSDAAIDEWMKQIGPSSKLRRWFGHDSSRWQEFKLCYWAELDECQHLVAQILTRARDRPVTLIYSARDTRHNQAIALLEYLSNQNTTGAER